MSSPYPPPPGAGSPWRPLAIVLGLLAVVVIGLPLTWLAVESLRGARQRRTVEAICRAGGSAELAPDDRPVPEWLRERLGEAFFTVVPYVDFPRGARDGDLAQLRDLRGVTYVGLDGCEITDAGLAELARNRGLVGLSLAGTQITDAGLARLAGLPLESLDVSATAVTDDAVRQLASIRSLNTLYLDHTNVTDESLRLLDRQPSLAELYVDDTPVSEQGWKRFLDSHPGVVGQWCPRPSEKHFRAAVHLVQRGATVEMSLADDELSGPWWIAAIGETPGASQHTDVLLAERWRGTPDEIGRIGDLEHVRSVTLQSRPDDGNPSVDSLLPAVARLEKVKELSICDPCLTGQGVSELSGMASLEALTLEQVEASDDVLRELREIPNLKSLSVDGTVVSDDKGMAHVAALANLETLCLDDYAAGITGSGLAQLKHLTRLRRLHLTGYSTTDSALVHVAGLRALRELSLDGSQVTDAGLEHLAGLVDLEQLSLAFTQVTGAGLVHLEPLRNLKKLDLSDLPITDDDLRHLTPLVHLEDLPLDDHDEDWSVLRGKGRPPVPPMSGEGLIHLKPLGSLRKLDLSGRPVTDKALAHLRGMAGLTHLRLDGAAITDAGLDQLAGLTNLEELSLRGTQVSDAGLVHLQKLTKLKSLDLTGTRVTPRGAAQLRKALPNARIQVDDPALEGL
jgi:internalin A